MQSLWTLVTIMWIHLFTLMTVMKNLKVVHKLEQVMMKDIHSEVF